MNLLLLLDEDYRTACAGLGTGAAGNDPPGAGQSRCFILMKV
jgi:hypothetical protein